MCLKFASDQSVMHNIVGTVATNPEGRVFPFNLKCRHYDLYNRIMRGKFVSVVLSLLFTDRL